MPDPAAFQAFGGVLAVLILLGGGMAALRRLGVLKPADAPEDGQRSDSIEARIVRMERSFGELRLHVAENYVARVDYVPNESRIIGMLENHGVMLARLDERVGAIREVRKKG